MRNVKSLIILFGIAFLVASCSRDAVEVSSLGDQKSTEEEIDDPIIGSKWDLTLVSLQRVGKSNCSGFSNCGYGSYPSCSIATLMTATRLSNDDIKLNIAMPGLVGNNFSGPLNADNEFSVDHEYWPGTSNATGYFDGDTVEVDVNWDPDPNKYDCKTLMKFIGEPRNSL